MLGYPVFDLPIYSDMQRYLYWDTGISNFKSKGVSQNSNSIPTNVNVTFGGGGVNLIDVNFFRK